MAQQRWLQLLYRELYIHLSMGHSDVQTRLIDLFLAELEQIQTAEDPINFNNTSQLDALLTYLENSDVPEFALVPSENVLHIILTLAFRCPQSSWTHSTVNGDNGVEVLSVYMREINDKYEHNLTKNLLQQRSVNILNRYVDIVLSSDSGNASLLFEKLQAVLRPICHTSIHFSRPRLKLEPTEADPVTEIIQDSEDDGGNIEFLVETETDLSSKYRLFGLPQKNVISLSDIGSKTTGLGEATSLFQNMPHLLAQATPEPEEHSPGPRAKKLKAERDPLQFIKLFDDHLIVNRLMDLKHYCLWDLLRWVFTCCEDSSQYQQFLFDSNSTALHGIWETYNLALLVMFRFLKEQHDVSQKANKRSFLNDLLTQLGRNQDWYERLVEVSFSGLGSQTQDRPFPCYPREKRLIKNDSSTSRSVGVRSKVEYDDNIQSMNLRAQIVATFLYHETNRFQKIELVAQLTEKLLHFQKNIIFTFLRHLAAQLFVPKKVLEKFVLMVINKLMITIVGSEDLAYNLIGYLDLTTSKIEKLVRLFQSSELYDGIVQDSTYKSFGEFRKAWDICIGLCYEMVKITVKSEVAQQQNLSPAKYEAISVALNTLKAAAEQRYIEFLRSRSWDAASADDDINFILDVDEIETHKLQYRKECNHDRLMAWISMFRPFNASK